MPKVEELERCYIGIATGDQAKVHFFNGSALEPIEALRAYPCDIGWSYGVQKTNTGFSILTDYFGRTENLNSAEALAQAFTDQFISTLQENEILFIEEFRIEDWLRVMRMLGEAA